MKHLEKKLQGKVAVVTGAARGIGRASAIALAREGAEIVAIDLCEPLCDSFGVTPARLEELVETGKKIEELGSRCLTLKLDQRDLSQLREAAVEAERVFGGIDILFANAGIQGFKPLLEMEDIDWHTQIDVNLTGTANAIRAFAPYLVKRGSGRIIVTTSTQGQHGQKMERLTQPPNGVSSA